MDAGRVRAGYEITQRGALNLTYPHQGQRTAVNQPERSAVRTIGLATVKTFGTALLGGTVLLLVLVLGIASLPWLFD